jgi:hypothetical protein
MLVFEKGRPDIPHDPKQVQAIPSCREEFRPSPGAIYPSNLLSVPNSFRFISFLLNNLSTLANGRADFRV